MSVASRAARCVRVAARPAGAALRTLALLLLLAVALLLPAPILGRLRFEPPGRRNKVTETRRRT
jgi:hypothetical protein